MADLSSILGASANSNKTDSELLVDAYKRTQQSRVDAINSRKTGLESRRSFYNTLNTKINSLKSVLDTFLAENASSKFQARSVTSSNSSVLTASAENSALLGNNEIFVERLAKNDILISQRLNLTDAFGEDAGVKSVGISVGGESKTVEVEFDGTENNQQALQKIVNAINNTEDIGVSASFVKDTSSTGRLTISSSTTGSDNRISFTDSSVFTKLGFTEAALDPNSNARTVSVGTGAGFRVADYEELDAKLDINGISVTRGSNTIDDLLTGVTLNLLKAQDSEEQPVSISTNINTAKVEELINPLLKSYNELLTFLRDSKSLQRQDPAISSLYNNVRSLATQAISGLEEGSPTYLTDIGIKINNDGTLSLSDKSKLEGILKDDTSQVSALFTSSDSFVSKIDSAIASLTGSSGLIQSRQKSLTEQIDSTAKRKTELEDRIDKQAQILRKEYEKSLKLFIEAQNQFSLISNYANYALNAFNT